MSAVSSVRFVDYIGLMKPELTSLSVLTTLCGFYLASVGTFDLFLFGVTALGTTLVGGGLGALNQYIERHYDAMMKRTERRPLPSARMLPEQAFWFGSIALLSGAIVLFAAVNLLTGILALITSGTYLFLYTPLKRVTSWSTFVGGIPGALPPMMGWAAARGELSSGAWVLFAILFFWQLPHFYALAWMYRKDYARAGFRMLTVNDEDASQTSKHIVWCCLALLPASLTLTIIGITGWKYSFFAILLGAMFLLYALFFLHFSGVSKNYSAAKVNLYSRQLFFASLLYLPALMIFMVVDKL